MRLVLRIAGTWLIGLALVLLVIDGTRSLGAGHLVLSSLSERWNALHPASLMAIDEFVAGRFFADLLDGTMAALLSWPAFVVAGVPGIILALLGRTPRRERYLRQDQI
jgi:hypothetical protein